MRFFGLSIDEVDMLLPEDHTAMLEAANMLEAQEQLMRFDVATFPHTDKKGRNTLFKRYHKLASPKKHDNKPVDLEQIRATLNKNKHLVG